MENTKVKGKDYVNLLKQCVAISSMNDPSSGGRDRVATMSHGGEVKFAAEEDYVIQILDMFYYKLKYCFKKKFILATKNQKYTFENEKIVKDEVDKQFE